MSAFGTALLRKFHRKSSWNGDKKYVFTQFESSGENSVQHAVIRNGEGP
jgi:hypothetical protein